MSGAKDDAKVATLDSGSDPARLRAAAELLSRFSEREKGRKALSKAEAEALIRSVASSQSLSRYFIAFGGDGKAAGLLLLAACPGVYGEWGLISELYVEEGRPAALAETLVAAAVEYGAGAKLRYLSALVPSAGEKTHPDRKALLEIVERLGFEKNETVLAERTL